jgi:HptB-dependent secretion and biofilm anti anti-sigma factor
MSPTPPSPQPFGVQAHDLGIATVVRFTGRRVALDEENTRAAGDQLLALAEGGGAGPLVVDLGNVSYLTSTALGLLLRLRQRLRAGGRRLALCGANPLVHEVFEATKLDAVFDLRPQAAG